MSLLFTTIACTLGSASVLTAAVSTQRHDPSLCRIRYSIFGPSRPCARREQATVGPFPGRRDGQAPGRCVLPLRRHQSADTVIGRTQLEDRAFYRTKQDLVVAVFDYSAKAALTLLQCLFGVLARRNVHECGQQVAASAQFYGFR